ncbi:hypothetical protein AB0E59_31130 [Lentzea sp. NPDC034063]|uniref:hypothetical protein n=1 Tax=unclassified Lentzea TaxID=2643253 RepID=UPI0033DE48EF
MGRKIATLLAGLSLLAVIPATAQAQDEIKLVLLDTEVQTYDTTYVSLTGCTTPTTASSPGFAQPAQLDRTVGGLGGIAQIGTKAGSFTATAECAGKSYSAQFTVVDRPPPNWSLYPLELEPGGRIDSITEKWSCQPTLTSPGFAQPFMWTPGGPRFIGYTTVVTTPGTYTATLNCGADRPLLTRDFTVKGTPPTSTTTTTPPAVKPAPKPAPKAPVVKPKGAPQTGGGGTA